jgi:20S proteasome alpha/beta subunit
LVNNTLGPFKLSIDHLPLLYSTIVGVKCKDGIILGTEKIIANKMMVSGTDKRIFSVNTQTGCVR